MYSLVVQIMPKSKTANLPASTLLGLGFEGQNAIFALFKTLINHPY